jgi:hypothetical protein
MLLGLALTDKVAYAASYLSDERLLALVNNMWRSAVEKVLVGVKAFCQYY